MRTHGAKGANMASTSKSRLTAAILQKLLLEIEQLFESEKYKEFLLFMSKFHFYSFYNTLLLMSQMPTLSIPASFTTWKEQGRWVKKGEKALTILIPVTKKMSMREQAKKNLLLHFMLVPVFLISHRRKENQFHIYNFFLKKE
jgi:hypothetical protein